MHQIHVDPAALDTAHTQILTSAGRIEGLIAALVAYLAPMQSSWSGSAADAADRILAQWDDNAHILTELLRQIGTAVDAVGANYSTIETGTTEMWTP